MANDNLAHGASTAAVPLTARELPSHRIPFTRLKGFENQGQTADLAALAELAKSMASDPDEVKDGPDPEENLWVPAGYTYFGQFVDHDLTFDSTSSLDPADKNRLPSNLRTPRFDLDCVYGDGPDAQPYMYAPDGATLLDGSFPETSSSGKETSNGNPWDLFRGPTGRAIIGDKRNDENSIVCQIQLGFIRYHNAIVQRLNGEDPGTWVVPDNLFESARAEVRWTYQLLLIHDFLPRIIDASVLAPFTGSKAERESVYKLYPDDQYTDAFGDVTRRRGNLPLEFVGAAYRFGHSGVRTGYRLNKHTKLSIFPGSKDLSGEESLLGFDPLPRSHVIDDWGRFLTYTAPGKDKDGTDIHTITGRKAGTDVPDPHVKLQYAYKIDTNLVDPLSVLPPAVAGGAAGEAARAVTDQPDPQRPSLALLNLLRGNVYQLPSGQAIANALQLTPLANELKVREDAAEDGKFKWGAVPSALASQTPLWFYILAEAQAAHVFKKLGSAASFDEDELLNGEGALTQLGPVGGRIIAEVFYGLLDSDPDSVFNAAAPHWKPRILSAGESVADVRLRRLLEFKA
ncbi:peroxidase family protein [Silvimonas iriomotensis]|uniref:Heme peroxidase n=1 Tax=Silvimonas iriomotensis TaxID=449662 RepID=A0ABQ2P5Q7_9NEIS|nr:peroxidase family protein [Silvimonas iriomotensis]GGP18839.1 heme peroxidase [Silvimonas iriomotensis]